MGFSPRARKELDMTECLSTLYTSITIIIKLQDYSLSSWYSWGAGVRGGGGGNLILIG